MQYWSIVSMLTEALLVIHSSASLIHGNCNNDESETLIYSLANMGLFLVPSFSVTFCAHPVFSLFYKSILVVLRCQIQNIQAADKSIEKIGHIKIGHRLLYGDIVYREASSVQLENKIDTFIT